MAHDQRRTKTAYTLQWDRFRVVRPEEDRATFAFKTGSPPEELAGRRVLDAGCGGGRYVRLVGQAGAEVVGMDLSDAVSAAREVTADLPNVSLLRGDLLRVPLRAGRFDFIYSLGVLDHTPAPRRAFLNLVPLLRPGGRIAVWVYPRWRPTLEWMNHLQRAVSTRLPLGLLMRLSRWSAPLGALKGRLLHSRYYPVQRFGVALNVLTIGVSTHPDPEQRVCDTLDWYAPRFQSHHTLEEVRSWFDEAKLVNVVNLAENQEFYYEGQGHGINLIGQRPKEDPCASDATQTSTRTEEPL